MSTSIRTRKSLILQQAFIDPASHKGCLRLLHHERVDWSTLQQIYEQGYNFSSIRNRVAVIDDTTCLSLNHLQGKLKVNDPDIGKLSGGLSLGQYYHVGLAYDLDRQCPLGLSYLKAYQGRFNSPTFCKDTYIAYELRESYRWHQCSEAAAKHFGNAQQVIRISDREADSYEYFEGCDALGLDYVVRSQHNRSLVDVSFKLHDYMREQAQAVGIIEMEVSSAKRLVSNVQLELHCAQLMIKAPEQRGKSGQVKGANRMVNVVYAVERNQHLLKPGEEALEWILLTSLDVNTIEQSIQVVQLYRLRWIIEELFKTLKSGVLQAESTQLGKGRAIKNLITIGMNEAFMIMSLKENRTNEALDVEQYFDKDQIAVLKLSNEQVQGSTVKQSNPYKEGSVAWAAWIIARLGAWPIGRTPPGTKVLGRGLRALNERVSLYQILSKNTN